MNLLYEKFINKRAAEVNDTTDITVFNFRRYEYEHNLEFIIDSMLKWLNNNTHDNYVFNYRYELVDDESSQYHIERTEALLLRIDYEFINKEANTKYQGSYELRIPKLVDTHFFYLYDNKYIPVLKLKERVIRFGPRKIIITCPHTVLTIDYLNSKGKVDDSLFVRVLTKKRIHIHDFFYYMYKNSDPNFLSELSEFMEYDFTRKPSTDKIREFAGHIIVFSKNKDIYDLDQILTNLLFTDYVKEVIKLEVGFLPKTIGELIKYLFRKFIFNKYYPLSDLRNLRNRRFVFLEDIMKVWANSLFLTSLVLTNKQKIKLNMNRDRIIKTFMVGDTNLNLPPAKYLYDYGSVYTSVKALISTQLDGDVTKTLRTLDTSYYNIICPVSTSSSEPGAQIHVNPYVKLTRFGHIVDRFKSLEQLAQEKS